MTPTTTDPTAAAEADELRRNYYVVIFEDGDPEAVADAIKNHGGTLWDGPSRVADKGLLIVVNTFFKLNKGRLPAAQESAE